MRPCLKRREPVGPEDSIKMEPQDPVLNSANEAPVCPSVQTAPGAYTLANLPVVLPPSFQQPQRKRKREANARVTKGMGEERLCKRPRAAHLEALPEEQQRNAQEESEQPPAQLQPRRSTRIQAMNGKKNSPPPIAENPAKPTSQKWAVRKK